MSIDIIIRTHILITIRMNIGMEISFILMSILTFTIMGIFMNMLTPIRIRARKTTDIGMRVNMDPMSTSTLGMLGSPMTTSKKVKVWALDR
jgi:hypothetical protein